MIPKLYDGRNKTFFMAAYEGVRAEGLSPAFATVPTARMRQGDFSEVDRRAIRNPFTEPELPRQHHSDVDALADVGERC